MRSLAWGFEFSPLLLSTMRTRSCQQCEPKLSLELVSFSYYQHTTLPSSQSPITSWTLPVSRSLPETHLSTLSRSFLGTALSEKLCRGSIPRSLCLPSGLWLPPLSLWPRHTNLMIWIVRITFSVRKIQTIRVITNSMRGDSSWLITIHECAHTYTQDTSCNNTHNQNKVRFVTPLFTNCMPCIPRGGRRPRGCR